jgi:hypothetical protein
MPHTVRTRTRGTNKGQRYPVRANDVSAFRDRKVWEVVYSDGSSELKHRRPKLGKRRIRHDPEETGRDIVGGKSYRIFKPIKRSTKEKTGLNIFGEKDERYF